MRLLRYLSTSGETGRSSPSRRIGLISVIIVAAPGSVCIQESALATALVEIQPPLEEPPEATLNDPCGRMPQPCTVLSDSSRTTALKEAVQRTPRTGGTIVVLPGTYTIDKAGFIFLANRDWLNIVGVLGSKGERPNLQGKQRIDGRAFDGVNIILNWAATNGNLILKNLELTGAASDCLASGSGKRKQVVQLHNVEMYHCGHHIWMHAWEPTGEWDDEVYAEDSSFHHAGLTHNVYIDRIAKANFVRIKSFSPRLLHAFKCVAIVCNIFASEISNANLDGTWDKDSSHWTHPKRQEGYLGSAPMSLVSCQKGQIRGNKIVFRFGPSSRTGHFVAARQPRHKIFGCDQPPYASESFLDESYWRLVQAEKDTPESIASSVRFFVMWWSYNEITVVRDENKEPVHMLLNNGTIPVKAVEPGSSRLMYIAKPEGWTERSRDYFGNNCLEGFRAEDKRFISRPWGAMEDPPNEDPNPGNRIFELAPNNCIGYEELPAWFGGQGSNQ